MSRLARATVAAVGLGLLGGGVAPLLGLLLAGDAESFCRRGRCCCASETTQDEAGRPCLRSSCGCGKPDRTAIAAPLRLEAVLPEPAARAGDEARRLPLRAPAARPLDQPAEPPIPPPRRLLPA